MNFKSEASPWNMPELGWRWGYPACLVVMGLTATSLVVYFWRKGWLGRPAAVENPGTSEFGQPRARR